ncbi:MAG: hypothetical protein R3286_03595 [Gammaproteobacteria bacterium]|nr:hypothetical protein [Gammaproteobacteria bacterium]
MLWPMISAVPFASLCHSAFAEDTFRIVARDHPEGGSSQMAPGTRLVLDASRMRFASEQDGTGMPPDTVAVQVLHDGRSDYYSVALPASRVVELGARTLRARSSPPFTGFPAGADVFVLVGREVGASSLDRGMFADEWTFVLRVR